MNTPNNHTNAPVLSRERVSATFDHSGHRVFTRKALQQIIRTNTNDWCVDESQNAIEKSDRSAERFLVARSLGVRNIEEAILANTPLEMIGLQFRYRPTRRYIWGAVSNLEIIQSLDNDGYFTHFTALHLHSLTDQSPKTIYFNVEQPTTGGGEAYSLIQDAIDRAFANKCRVSRNIATLRDQKVCRLNGRHTGQLGVVDVQSEMPSATLRVTEVERTLIDATVRPVYAGGIFVVAQAFKEAAGRVSIQKLATMLEELDFTYPYHQAIGFYLERAGTYDDSEIALMRQFGLNFDFYLDYGIRNPEYRENWRLFVPKRF